MTDLMFNLMTQNILSQDDTNTPGFQIDQSEYEAWKKLYTFDALQYPARYGQSFCNHFGITDYILYYALEVTRADDYIKKNYVR